MPIPGLPPEFPEAGFLEQVLRRSGALGEGRVRDVTIADSRPQILSRITRLAITYEGDPGPPVLVVKSGLPELDAKGFRGGATEVAFYTQVAPSLPAGLVARCHDAQWNEADKGWHLLLEDLDASHAIATRWPLPPAQAQCVAIVQALAGLHAHWWGHARLGDGIGELPDDDVAPLATAYAGFSESLGDALTGPQRELYARLWQGVGAAIAGRRPRTALTVVHGDAHMWNVFLPRDGTTGGPRWFDWDSWRVDLGANDLAYMVAMHWHPQMRRLREAALLDAYHAGLLQGGVTGYTRAQLDDDYRLCVLLHLAAPVHQWAIGVPPVIWWNNLQRLLMAVDDLGCRDLLG